MEYNQCYFKKFHRDEFYVMKASDIIKDVLNDGDMVEIMVRKTKNKEKVRKATPEAPATTEPSAIAEEVKPTYTVFVDGSSLDLDTIMILGAGEVKITIHKSTMEALRKTRSVVDGILKTGSVRYGINTGFGILSKVVVPSDKLEELNYNIIRSHCAGIGEGLTLEATRRMLALRINVLTKAYSGCSPELVEAMVNMFNNNCLPFVPAQGTVGASGDLAPLAHLASGVIGEGRMWSPKTDWGEAAAVLAANGLAPYKLAPKDGLSLINGAQFICALGVEALERGKQCLRTSIVITAMILDVLDGHIDAFDEGVHNARPHPGQIKVAATLRALCHSKKYPSEIYDKCEKHDVQDPYTIRCTPQVFGVVLDTMNFVEGILTTEMNSATDNPLVFTEKEEIISAGNFHGEYPAKGLDFLTIAVHEIGNMSERRLERLCNPICSNLPAFLVENPGVNSGFMIPHCTSAALVSENKTLCFPASADTQSTSAGKEDHVSMGGWAARKALKVVKNLENVLAIELIAACQALEFKRPHRTTEPLEAVLDHVRTKVEPYIVDRSHTEDIVTVQKMIQNNEIWDVVSNFIDDDPFAPLEFIEN